MPEYLGGIITWSNITWYFIFNTTMAKAEYKSEFNTLRPRQDVRHFPEDIFKCIVLNENV